MTHEELEKTEANLRKVERLLLGDYGPCEFLAPPFVIFVVRKWHVDGLLFPSSLCGPSPTLSAANRFCRINLSRIDTQRA